MRHKKLLPTTMRSDTLKSMVYGGLDGIITTFAIVSGVVGASLPTGVIIVLGFANLIADAISMAAGDYLSTRAQQDLELNEKVHLEKDLGVRGEEKELHDYYKKEGLNEKEITQISLIMEKHKPLLTKMLLREEHHMHASEESALHNALVTFFSFQVFGLIPLLTYLLSFVFPAFGTYPFFTASVLVAFTLVILGLIRGTFTHGNLVRAAIETLVIGGLAAGAAYFVGWGIGALVGL